MNHRGRGGRGVAQLVADFGHRLPPVAAPMRPAVDGDPLTAEVGKHGRRGPAAGWAAVPAPLAVYRMTSEQTGGVWPLIAGGALPPTGAQLGIDYLSGGAFHVDPVGWTLAGLAGVTNPNLIIFGAPGRGKTATVKMFCLRMMAYQVRTLVLGDVKDEYEPLCRALGVEPHAVGHGLPARINPLDFGPLGNDWSAHPRAEAQRRAAMVFSRWLLLIKGLVGSQHVAFGPTAETAIGHVIRELTGYTAGADRMAELTIPHLWRALTEPSERLVAECRYADRQHFLDDTRAVRDALGALVNGHLSGLFDAPTTVRVDWAAPIQSLSLSRLDPLGDEAVGVALTCLNSWGRAMTQLAVPGDNRIIIRDECWKQMRLGTDAVKSLDADLRLSRRDGAIQIVVAHKPSDMLTVGDAGSQAVSIARTCCTYAASRCSSARTTRSATNYPSCSACPPWPNGSSPTGPPPPAAARCGWSGRTRRRCRPCKRHSTSRSPTQTSSSHVKPEDRHEFRPSSSIEERVMTAVGPATVAAAAATPLVAAAALLIVAAGGVSRSLAAFQCGGAGTGQTIAGVRLDAEQVGNAGSIVSVVARRQLPAFAAEVAVTTAYTESALRNSITQTDHDSEGLFQQRVSIYGREVADNPVSATNAFLDRLLTVAGWRANPVGVDAQAVQRSAYPLRYQPNTALAQQLVSALWPTADLGGAAVCPGAGGAAVGAALANPGSGTTRIPSGLVITGTAQGHAAVMFALKQLGKPYVFGAAGPDAFDCSGLTLAAWASAGIALPHLAADQADQGTPEPADLSAAVGGDLVLIPGSDGTAANPGHVGMIAGYVDRADGRHLYLVQAADVDVPIELTDAHEWDGQIVAVRHIG